MCLEWMFCNCLLVLFKLKLRCELIKIRRGGGLQIYPRVLGVCPKLNLHGYLQGICGLNGVFGAIVHNAPIMVWQRSAPRGHFSGVSASFGYFATTYGLIEALDFCLMVVDWGRWRLSKIVTHISFDAVWLIKQTVAKYKGYTLESCQF